MSAEMRKHKKYDVVTLWVVANLTNSFPLPWRPLTLLEKNLGSLVYGKDLGGRLIESSGELRSRAYLTQRISIDIQRPNLSETFPQPFLLPLNTRTGQK
jgi:hypothetical protein